jgi:hypothetical protein
MHAALDIYVPEPLPPPPRRPRLARGSVPPYDLAIDVRTIEAPVNWSRVVPVPLPARRRLLDSDRAAAMMVGCLGTLTAILAILLVR